MRTLRACELGDDVTKELRGTSAAALLNGGQREVEELYQVWAPTRAFARAMQAYASISYRTYWPLYNTFRIGPYKIPFILAITYDTFHTLSMQTQAII